MVLTVQELKVREKNRPYSFPKYKGCTLELRREFEHEDREFGEILLRVREQFEISRAHLWDKEGGWNVQEPIWSIIFGFDPAMGGRIGGKVTAAKNKASGEISARGKRMFAQKKGLFAPENRGKGGKKGGVTTGRMHAESGHCARIAHLGGLIGGIRGGQTNIKSGHAAAMGRKWGKINGHNAWHVKRNKPNPKCVLCFPQSEEQD